MRASASVMMFVMDADAILSRLETGIGIQHWRSLISYWKSGKKKTPLGGRSQHGFDYNTGGSGRGIQWVTSENVQISFEAATIQ